MKLTRRRFIQAATATTVPYLWTASRARCEDKNSRLRLGMIGCGGKGRDDAQLAAEHGDFVAVCDVQRSRARRYAENPNLNDDGRRKLDIYADDNELLARDDIDTGPLEIEGTGVHDTRENCFNTAQTFHGTMTFAGGTKLIFEDGGPKTNGILLQGDQERIFVNRGKLVDKITADASWNAKIREAAGQLYDGPYGLPDVKLKNYSNVASSADSSWTRVKQSHMANFFRCIETGAQPISDVVTVGNGTITCQLANIALRLGRKLTWNPATETFAGEDQANAMLARKQREGYEITAAT